MGSQSKGGSLAMTYVIFLLGILFLSFTAPWQKLSNFDPATGAFLRCLIGALALLPFAMKEAKKMGKMNKKGIYLSIVAGIVLGIDFTAWNFSIYFVGSGIASILLNIQVIMLPALAYFADKEKIPFSYYFIAPIMLAGVILAGGALETGLVDPNSPKEVYGFDLAVLGTICGLTSGVCYGIYLFASRRAGRINNGQVVQPIFISSVAQLVAPIVFMVFFSSRGLDLTNGVFINTDTKGHLPLNPETTVGDPITMMNWMWMIVLGVAGQAMAWTFTQYGSIKLNPTLGAGLLILSPIATVAVIAPLMFGESLSMLQIIGVIIALLAVAYQNGLLHAIFGKSAKKA